MTKNLRSSVVLYIYRPHSVGMGKVMFSQTSVRSHLLGGYPHLANVVGVPLSRLGWGVPPSQVRMGAYPLPRSRWGYSLLRSGWGYPLLRSGWGYGVPLPSAGWRTPCQQGGVPPSRSQVRGYAIPGQDGRTQGTPLPARVLLN